jgi:hypothetical protein
MNIKVGRIIKLKDYTEYSKYRNGEYAEISGIYSGERKEITIKFIKDDVSMIVKRDNIEVISYNRIKTVFSKLKEGNIVLTNGDGSTKCKEWILGEIGEITVKDGIPVFYLWNNKKKGSKGKKRVRRYKYSWLIKGTNNKASIIIVDATTGEDRKYCCFECKKEFSEKELIQCVDDEYYCDDCKSEKFSICEECGDEILAAEAIYSDLGGADYCSNCYNDNFVNCHHCDEELRIGDAQTGADDNTYCDSCWSERFIRCDDCGNTEFMDDVYYDEEEDRSYCQHCHRGERRSSVLHDYGYAPSPEFYKFKWDIPFYMGVELEVQRDENYGRYADKFMDFLTKAGTDKYFYLKHDGSLHDKGFEIVSQPFTLQYAHKNLGFNKILKWLKDNELTSEESGDCGLHIHISKNFFEERDIIKLRLFFKQNAVQLRQFSKRGKDDTDYTYCRFEDTEIKEIIKNKEQEGRYWAVNLNSSRETVELRLFRGTLDITRFIAILQFVDAVSHFVKEIGVTSLIIGEGKYRGNSWELFTDWCKEENKYEAMLKYFSKEKICV